MKKLTPFFILYCLQFSSMIAMGQAEPDIIKVKIDGSSINFSEDQYLYNVDLNLTLGETFEVYCKAENDGDDSPSGFNGNIDFGYNNITFSFPEFTNSSDKYLVDIVYGETDNDMEDTYGEFIGGDYPYLWVEVSDDNGWDGDDIWPPGNEENEFAVDVEPESYGTFVILFRVGMSNQESWDYGWSHAPSNSPYTDSGGFDVYKIIVHLNNENTEPEIFRNSPSQQNVIVNLGDSQEFSVIVHDDNGDLDKVKWYVNDDHEESNNVSGTDDTDDWEYEFDEEDDFEIKAKVFDENDNWDYVTWNVTVVDSDPTITRLYPLSATLEVEQGDEIEFKAEVFEHDGESDFDKVVWEADNYPPYIDDYNSIFWTNPHTSKKEYTFEETGTVCIEATVYDKSGDNASLEWCVTVVNPPPYFTDDIEDFTDNEDCGDEVLVDLIDFIDDPNDDPEDLTVFVVSEHSSGWLNAEVVSGDYLGFYPFHNLHINPEPNANGCGIIRVRVSDGDSYDEQDINVCLLPLEDDPEFFVELQDFQVEEDCGYTTIFHLDDYAHDVDLPNNDMLVFEIDNNPDNWIHADIEGHDLVINPDANQFGDSDIRIKVSDPEGNYDKSTFNLEVLPMDDPPIVTIVVPDQDYYQADFGEVVDFTAYGYDIDEDLDYAKWYYDGIEIDGSHDEFWAFFGDIYDHESNEDFVFIEQGEHTIECRFFDKTGLQGSCFWTINVAPPPSGDLHVAVRNINGTLTPYPGDYGVVRLYSEDTNLEITFETTNNGVAQFKDIIVDDYFCKFYHQPTYIDDYVFDEEYWGQSGVVSILEDQPISYDHVRDFPYGEQFRIFMGIEDVTGQTVPAGISLNIRYTFSNPNEQSQNISARVILDKDKQPSFAFDQTGSYQVVESGSSGFIDFSWIPTNIGDYYRTVGTLTNVDGENLYTDTWAWSDQPIITISELLSVDILTPSSNISVGVGESFPIQWAASGSEDAIVNLFWDVDQIWNNGNEVLIAGGQSLIGELNCVTNPEITGYLNICAVVTDGSFYEVDYTEAPVHVVPLNEVLLELHAITNTNGELNSEFPGENCYSFLPGETVRITFKASNLGPDIPVQSILNILRNADGAFVYDSDPSGLNNSHDSPLGNNETDYYSFDWGVPMDALDGLYDIGASIRNLNNIEVIYDVTGAEANSDFNEDWLLLAQFEINSTNDASPPNIEVWRVYQTGDFGLRVVARITDLGVGIDPNSVKIRYKRFRNNIFSITREDRMYEFTDFPGFYEGVADPLLFDYDNGDAIVFQVVAEDFYGNEYVYPKDLPNLERIDVCEIDSEHQGEWCGRVYMYDAEHLGDENSFFYSSAPSGAITFEMDGNDVKVYNNTAIWYTLDVEPDLFTIPYSYVFDATFLTPKSGLLPLSLSDWIGDRSITLNNATEYDEINLYGDRKSPQAAFKNSWDMLVIMLEQAFPLVSDWNSILECFIQAIDEGAMAQFDSSTYSFEERQLNALDYLLSEEGLVSLTLCIYEYLLSLEINDLLEEMVGQKVMKTYSLILGINNRLGFLIDLIRFPNDQEYIKLIKDSPLYLDESSIPGSDENAGNDRLYINEDGEFNIIIDVPLGNRQSYYKTYAIVKLYSPEGDLIEVSNIQGYEEIYGGSLDVSFLDFYHEQGASWNPMFYNNAIGINFKYDFDISSYGHVFESSIKPYYIEVLLFQNGFPDMNVSPYPPDEEVSSGKVAMRLYDKIAPQKPSILGFSSTSDNYDIVWTVRPQDKDISHYLVYRELQGENEFVEVGVLNNSGKEKVYYHDYFDEPQYSLSYKIRAVDISGNVSVFSDEYHIELLNLPPEAFELVSPADDEVIDTKYPYFIWDEAIDPEGAAVCYELHISEDINFNNSQVYNEIFTNAYQLEQALDDNSIYYWKVKAIDLDGKVRWAMNDHSRFIVNLENEEPELFSLLEPSDQDVLNSNIVTFNWEESDDDDPYDDVVYDLYITDNITNEVIIVESIEDNEYSVENDLEFGKSYTWKVKAIDESGNGRWSNELDWQFSIEQINRDPILSNTDEVNYANSFFYPIQGNEETLFTFKVKYQDADNHEPLEGYPLLHLLQGNQELQDSPYNLQAVEISDVIDGRIYTVEIPNLLAGDDYTFYFEGYDAEGNLAEGNATEVQAGPIINKVNLLYPNLEESLYANGEVEVLWEGLGDFVYYSLYYSLDNGSTWEDIVLNLPPNQLSYDWSIPNVVSDQALIKIRGIYSSGDTEDICDETISIIESVNAPTSFSLLTPTSNAIQTSNVTFVWENSFEPNGLGLTYDLWISEDSEFLNKDVWPDINESTITISQSFIENSTYYWKVKAINDLGQVTWANEQDWYFHINMENTPPNTFSLLTPGIEENVSTTRPNFSWTPSLDVDPEDVVSYTLVLGTNSSFEPGTFELYPEIYTTSFIFPENLSPSQYYYWKVKAVDSQGAETWCLNQGRWFVTPSCPVMEITSSTNQQVCINSLPELLSIQVQGGQGELTYQWYEFNENSEWIGIEGANNMSYQADQISSSKAYRVKVSDECSSSWSESISVDIYNDLLVDVSQSEMICFNENATTLSVIAIGNDGVYTYQWQILVGTEWVDIEGAVQALFEPGQLQATSSYRVIVDGCCEQVTSEVIDIIVYEELNCVPLNSQLEVCYNTQPDLLEVNVNGGKGDYEYQWQQINDGVFEDIEGATQNTYQPSAIAQDTSYRLKVSDDCGIVYSEPIVATVHDPVSAELFGEQIVCSGNAPQPLEVIADGGYGSYSYQWQINASNNWQTLESGTDPTYQPEPLSGPYEFRTVVENQCGDYTTNSVLISVYDQLAITCAPIEQVLCSGEESEVLQATPSGGNGEWSYQWLVNGGLSSESSSNLDLGIVSESKTVTVEATNECGTVYGETMIVNLTEPLLGEIQEVATCCYGYAPEMLQATISGGNINNVYQWELFNGSEWVEINGQTDLSYQPGELYENTQYRLKVQNGCEMWISESVMIELYAPLAVELSGYQSICSNTTPEDLVPNITGGDGNYLCIWEEFSNGQWNEIYSTNEIVFNPGNLIETTSYRVVVINQCGEVTSESYTINVLPVIIGTVSSNQTICYGALAETLILSVEGGSTNDTYEWQKRTDGNEWVIIPGTNGLYHTPSGVEFSTWYRALIDNQICGIISSDSALIEVIQPIQVELESDQWICPDNDPDALTAYVTGGAGVVYDWYIRIGGYWQHISEENELTYSPGILTQTQQYKFVASDDCSSDSDSVTITVYEPIDTFITANQQVCYGEDANPLHAHVNPEAGPVDYQWQSWDGTNWSPVGENSDSYLPENMTASTTYQCILTSDCDSQTSNSVIIEVLPELIVNAGSDQNVCQNDQIQLIPEVFGNTTVYWETSSANGYFDNPSELQTNYNMSWQDIQNGEVILTLTCSGQYGCDDVVSDELIVNIQRKPEVLSLDAEIICEDEQAEVSAEAEYYSSSNWTTNGTGTFVNPNSMETHYNPSEEDILNGGTQLTFTANALLPCISPDSENVNLVIYRIPEAPQQPQGPEELIINEDGSVSGVYSVPEVQFTDWYTWYVDSNPTPAISGNGNSVTITWSNLTDAINAVISVNAANEYCEGPQSEALHVNIVIDNVEGYSGVAEISVAPNPTNGKFEVRFENFHPGNYSVQIHNSIGQIVDSREVLIYNQRLFIYDIDLSGDAKGVYMIHIVGEDGIWKREVVLR